MESAFKKALVVNRGEIAIRSAHARQWLGIRTVALCSDDDKRLNRQLPDGSQRGFQNRSLDAAGLGYGIGKKRGLRLPES